SLRIVSTLPPELDDLVRRTIGALIAVHRGLGPGMNESIYHAAAEVELMARGIRFESERSVPVRYRGHLLGHQRIDLLIEGRVIVELKSVEQLHPAHIAQAVSCLRV